VVWYVKMLPGYGRIFCTTYGCGATGRQTWPIFRFWPLSEVYTCAPLSALLVTVIFQQKIVKSHFYFYLQCIRDDRDEYRVYLLLLAHNASKDAGRRRRLVGDHVTGRVRLCAKDGDVNSSSVEHVVKEVVVTERRQGLRTLNIVMVDSYIHDNVDYFYVVHSVTKPTDIDLFDNSSTLPIR